VSSLTAGTTYSCSVTATNAAGTSGASNVKTLSSAWVNTSYYSCNAGDSLSGSTCSHWNPSSYRVNQGYWACSIGGESSANYSFQGYQNKPGSTPGWSTWYYAYTSNSGCGTVWYQAYYSTGCWTTAAGAAGTGGGNTSGCASSTTKYGRYTVVTRSVGQYWVDTSYNVDNSYWSTYAAYYTSQGYWNSFVVS
jgi:hypothetical protein